MSWQIANESKEIIIRKIIIISVTPSFSENFETCQGNACHPSSSRKFFE
jgi:hypothetical protein